MSNDNTSKTSTTNNTSKTNGVDGQSELQRHPGHRWTEGSIIYQIYPRSYQDSNGDGVGDLKGITSRLPYLRDLGINGIWISPMYPSPMIDFGYDISDYCNVDPLFGTLDDFKELLQVAHDLHIKVMLDLVPNHTSSHHKWFIESRSSRDNPKADWYIWRDGKEGSTPEKPIYPNNWLDVFNGDPAWEWDETRKQYYLHSFHAQQPDLNYANPEVLEALQDVIRFWLKLGVDGFRVDAVLWMAKDKELRDEAKNPKYVEGRDMPWYSLIHDKSSGSPELWHYLTAMAKVFQEEQFQDHHRFMVLEAYPDYREAVASYIEFYKNLDPAHVAPFNFSGITLPWTGEAWHDFLSRFHSALEDVSPLCIPSYAFSNHDHPRMVSRVGEAAARSVAVMLMTLPGMVFVYYGDELGMENTYIPPERSVDPAAKSCGHGEQGQGRDPERTPMLWNKEPYAGFSPVEPWLPVTKEYETKCVEAQKEDPQSFYNLYKALIHLRQSHNAVKYGSISLLESNDKSILAYCRPKQTEKQGIHYLIVRNFSDKTKKYDPHYGNLKCILSSDPKSEVVNTTVNGSITLHPYEALVFTHTERQ